MDRPRRVRRREKLTMYIAESTYGFMLRSSEKKRMNFSKQQQTKEVSDVSNS